MLQRMQDHQPFVDEGVVEVEQHVIPMIHLIMNIRRMRRWDPFVVREYCDVDVGVKNDEAALMWQNYTRGDKEN